MPFDLAVIDLDNTLYAADSGVFARMDRRMTAFVARELDVDHQTANALRVRYWRQYGTTLRGMMLHHGMDPEPFLQDVHDIGVHEMLEKDTELDEALSRLPGSKVIHTNGIREHAERILDSLDITHHFDVIYDIRFNNYVPKPCGTTLAILIKEEKSSPERTIVVDDMPDNLYVARELGAITALISHEKKNGTWDYHVPSVQHLPDALAAGY